jgi:hypothetical protein
LYSAVLLFSNEIIEIEKCVEITVAMNKINFDANKKKMLLDFALLLSSYSSLPIHEQFNFSSEKQTSKLMNYEFFSADVAQLFQERCLKSRSERKKK